jgi:L-lactate dehydrogenase complex protein LldG
MGGASPREIRGRSVSGAAADARAEILGRVSRALRDRPPVTRPPEGPRAGPSLGSGDLVERFAERVSDYRATVLFAAQDHLATVIANAISGWGSGQIVVPDGFPAAWLPENAATWLHDDPPLSHRQLDALDGVLTLCALGIAETGTVVLDGGQGQGRRALSLVPDRHLCIVRAEQVVADVPDAIERLNPTRPLTWISGPSATSDIELERVEGVHGPRTLVVVIATA